MFVGGVLASMHRNLGSISRATQTKWTWCTHVLPSTRKLEDQRLKAVFSIEFETSWATRLWEAKGRGLVSDK